MDDSDFLTHLYKLHERKYDLSGSDAEVQDRFRSDSETFLQTYLESFASALESMKVCVNNFLDFCRDHKSDANAKLNVQFELHVAYEITRWLATDETLQGRLKKMKTAYAARLSKHDLDLIFSETLDAAESSIAFHVASARNYGSTWTDLMNSLGISAIMDDTGLTIERLKNLTIDDLKQSLKS